jgi:hypothetical protein
MKMQDQRLIRGPPHPYDVALFDADEPHRIGDATMLHLEIKGELSGRRAEERAARHEQQTRRYTSGKHNAIAKHQLSLAFHRREFD